MKPNQNDDDLKVWDIEGHDLTQRVPLNICPTHTKEEWTNHHGYIDNHDGTVSCKFCPWGTYLPGYMRCLGEKIVDLRTPAGS